MNAVTDREMAAWQIKAVAGLSALLAAAYVADLPPLEWRATRFGDLLGDVPPILSADAALEVFRAWVAFLSADERGATNRRRTAVATYYPAGVRTGGHKVTILADYMTSRDGAR